MADNPDSKRSSMGGPVEIDEYDPRSPQRAREQRESKLREHFRHMQDREAPQMSRGGGCFPGQTLISTPQGQRAIAQLSPGDLVMSVPTGRGESRPRRILRNAVHTNCSVWQIDLAQGGVVRTTANHSFSVNGRWRRADALRPGDQLDFLQEGRLAKRTVALSRATNERVVVYNLIVEKEFAFVANGAVVHSFTRLRWLRILLWSMFGSLQSVFRWEHRRRVPREGQALGSREGYDTRSIAARRVL